MSADGYNSSSRVRVFSGGGRMRPGTLVGGPLLTKREKTPATEAKLYWGSHCAEIIAGTRKGEQSLSKLSDMLDGIVGAATNKRPDFGGFNFPHSAEFCALVGVAYAKAKRPALASDYLAQARALGSKRQDFLKKVMEQAQQQIKGLNR